MKIYILVILSFISSAIFSLDEIHDCEVEYYDINGNSAKKLIKEMKEKNNIQGGYFGYTRYSYKNLCPGLETKCKVRIPKWIEYEESGNETLKVDWSKFYNALIHHEQEHVNIFRKPMNEAIQQSDGKSCSTSNMIYKTALQEIAKKQIQFDKKTEHGVKQGAYLKTAAYQAIAFAADTGKYGFAHDYSTQEQAELIAVEHCNASDCKVVIWSNNACTSLAVGYQNGYGTSWAKDSKESQKKALVVCKKYTTKCKILKTVCPLSE